MGYKDESPDAGIIASTLESPRDEYLFYCYLEQTLCTQHDGAAVLEQESTHFYEYVFWGGQFIPVTSLCVRYTAEESLYLAYQLDYTLASL